MSSSKLFSKESFVTPHEVKDPLVFSVIFYVLFAFVGYAMAETYPDQIAMYLEELGKMVSSVAELSIVGILFFIFLKNIFVAFLASLGGILFTLLPVVIIVANGLVLGIVFHLVTYLESTEYFFLGILPHGIVELPAILFSTAIGIWLGGSFFRFLFFGTETRSSLKEKAKRALGTYILIIVPLLFLSALIEVFGTPLLLNHFFDINPFK